jgi:probable F420-dependent oxidoreductase
VLSGVIQLTISLPTFAAAAPESWEQVRGRAIAADLAGIDRVVCSEHIAFGDNLDAYGDPRAGGLVGGRQPTGPDGQWLDPLTVLTWVAGSTSRVRLCTNILLAGLRRPALLAKQLATMDVLSGGRLEIGVGTGWQAAEYEAAGLAFADRGRLLDHNLAVCAELWSNERVTFADELLQFDGIHQMPKPLQPGGVPVWIGGRASDAVVQRIARHAIGWLPWGVAKADLASAIRNVKERVEALGREDAQALQIAGNMRIAPDDLAASVAAIEPLVTAGVTDLRLAVPFTDHEDTDVESLTAIVDAIRKEFA